MIETDMLPEFQTGNWPMLPFVGIFAVLAAVLMGQMATSRGPHKKALY